MKGIDNTAADFLSRIDCEVDSQVNKESEFIDRFVYNIPSNGNLLDEILEEQTNDPAIAFSAKQLNEQGIVLSGRYRNQRLVLSNGLVKRENRILIPDHLHETVFTRVHNVSHPGIKRTLYLLKQQFTWNGMHSEVLKLCKECGICQREKGTTKAKEPLVPNRAAHEPRQMVAYDVATLPWGSDQNRYFLLMTDLFSKWVEIAPMRDQTSSSVMAALKTYWIYRHGPPQYVLSDQGPNVDGSEIREALDMLGIKKLRSSPYHPEGDGQAERNIQTVKQTLRCIISDRELEKDCWPIILQEVAHSLNTLPNSSTRLTAFHIMHGVEPISNPRPPANERDSRMTKDCWYEEASHSVENAIDSARNNAHEYREKMKKTYDRGKEQTDVTTGPSVPTKRRKSRRP